MRSLWLILMVSLPVYGGVIVDASSATSMLLHHDESLAFQILTENFGFNAAHLGLDSYPTDVSFSFATAPVAAPASVSAWLESPDGSLSVVFAGPPGFTSGLWSSSQYGGPVSVLQGYMHLTGATPAEIFGSGAAQVVLRNDGDDLALGLPPTTLRQDLSVDLTGGPLSVGAVTPSVTLISAASNAPAGFGAVSLENQAPEPASLLPVALVLLLLGLTARPKNQPFANR